MQQLYFSGEVYKIALKVQTKIREMATLIWLRYPQPVSLRAGGLEIRDHNADQKIEEGIKGIRGDIEKLLYVAKELREFIAGMYKDIGVNFVAYGLLEPFVTTLSFQSFYVHSWSSAGT